MKRLIAIVLVLLVFAGCGSNGKIVGSDPTIEMSEGDSLSADSLAALQQRPGHQQMSPGAARFFGGMAVLMGVSMLMFLVAN